MKALVLLISVFSLTAAQAVVRKDCPESIKVTFNQFKMNDVIDDNFEPQDVNDIAYDGYNDLGMLRLRKNLRERGTITATLKKQNWNTPAKCNYRGQTTDGQYASARLEGSLRAGAKDPATMVFYNGSLVVYVNLASIKPTGLEAKLQSVPLYYAGEWCSWGDCIPNHIQVGEGNLAFLK